MSRGADIGFLYIRELTPSTTYQNGNRRTIQNSGQPEKANLYDIQRTLCYADNRDGFRVYPKSVRQIFKKSDQKRLNIRYTHDSNIQLDQQCSDEKTNKLSIIVEPPSRNQAEFPPLCPVSCSCISSCSSLKRQRSIVQVIPPAPRLVGIEPNPGPGKKVVLMVGGKKKPLTARPQPKQKRKKEKPSNSGMMNPLVGVAAAYASLQNFPGKGNKNRSRRIVNKELVAPLSGTSGFTASKYSLNPGIVGTFPWLSTIAADFKQYRFHRLKFHYITRCGSSTAGSMILSPFYDPKDPAPTTETQATDTQDAVEDAPWKDFCCALDINALFELGPRKLIRSSITGGDLATYDCGNLFACTTDGSATNWGKLWVEYDVELFVPHTGPPDYTYPTRTSEFSLITANQAFTNGVAAALQYNSVNYDPLGIGAPVAGVFTPLAGNYNISACNCFSDTSSETFTVQTQLFKNGAALSPTINATSTNAAVANGAVDQSVIGIISCNGTDTFQIQITLTGAAGTLRAATGYCTLLVTPA